MIYTVHACSRLINTHGQSLKGEKSNYQRVLLVSGAAGLRHRQTLSSRTCVFMALCISPQPRSTVEGKQNSTAAAGLP